MLKRLLPFFAALLIAAPAFATFNALGNLPRKIRSTDTQATILTDYLCDEWSVAIDLTGSLTNPDMFWVHDCASTPVLKKFWPIDISMVVGLQDALDATAPLDPGGTSSDYIDGTGAVQPLTTASMEETSLKKFHTIARAQAAVFGQGVSNFENDAGYIDATALEDYLTTTDAATTYLDSADAVTIYLSQATATSDYLTKLAAASAYVPVARTVNGHALSGNINVTSSDLSLATVASTGAYSDLTGKPTIPTLTRTFNYPSRALNSCFQISSTQDADFHYKVDIASGTLLTTSATGTVVLTSYTNSGCTTGAQVVTDGAASQGAALGILSVSQTVAAALDGIVPAGKWIKITTAQTVGTPTFAIRAAQSEILLPM